MANKFTHINNENQPAMVDVSDKNVTKRTAKAQAIVVLHPEVIQALENTAMNTKKGPVFHTAILAGIMGAKKTSDLIPLCHPLGLSKCSVDIAINDYREIVITCTAKINSQTGVEMEALTGASVAALTVYDMCKSFSHDIIIKEVKLIEKTGGKSDYKLLE